MTRSRVCSSNAAPTRTGASPRRPQGRALHAAASAGKRELVELLLAHGADPNSGVDSSGVPVSAAATPEIRALLVARGGTTDPYDTSWIDDDAELGRVAGDPTETVRVSAGFAMVVGDGRRDRLERLLTAGLRVPSVLTGCQGYLLAHTDMLRTLLAHGMSPDLMNWQHQTLLHLVCQAQDYRGRDKTNGAVERAAILLDAGAEHFRAGRGISIDAARLGGAHERRGDGGVSPRTRRPHEPSRR